MALETRKGYSLMEMMLTVAIMGILGAFATPLMFQMTNFWRMTSARYAIQKDVRASLGIINRFAREGIASTVAIDSLAGQPPASRLSISCLVVNSTDTTNTVAVTFYQSGKNLYMTKSGRTTRLSDNLAYIAFTYPKTDDTSLISVAMTMQSATYRGGSKALQLSIQKVRIMN